MSHAQALIFARVQLEIQEEIAEVKALNETATIGVTGWFSDSEDLDQFSRIFDHLLTNIRESELDPAFASSALDWCHNAILQLNSEKGQMSGITVHHELGHSQQQSLLLIYDAQIEAVAEVEDMISNWSKETVGHRKEHLEALSSLFLQASSDASSIVSQAGQIVYNVENVQLKELEQRDAEYNRKIRQIQRRRTLAVAGIVVGLAIFLALVVSTARPKAKAQKTPRTRSRRNSSKRKGKKI